MITTQDLEHLAKLSRIKLTEDDKKSLIKEFDSILGYVDQLKKVEVNMDGASRLGAVKNVVREDAVISSDSREELLNEAPDREGEYVAVKKIIAQDIKI
jgi:aspartyl-tRNA(Asn)/glutamyl-tRNA(Gln) amidotransferase subunit C